MQARSTGGRCREARFAQHACVDSRVWAARSCFDVCYLQPRSCVLVSKALPRPQYLQVLTKAAARSKIRMAEGHEPACLLDFWTKQVGWLGCTGWVAMGEEGGFAVAPLPHSKAGGHMQPAQVGYPFTLR